MASPAAGPGPGPAPGPLPGSGPGSGSGPGPCPCPGPGPGPGSCSGSDPGPEPAAECACLEAQRWIEAATGRCLGDKDFRGGLENGILLCELLSCIKPGLVKKINRLQTPIAGLDNLSVFLRGCEDLGLKGSQLFEPGDLQDASTRPNAKLTNCSRKLKNVLITLYWLGRAANACTSYSGPTLDLKEFEGLLAQMRKEAEDADSPKGSTRDSGYIDCWDSERSESLSPPRHAREDSFDSLDSFGSRSQQTPSPDVQVPHSCSDGHGSDSESDTPTHRKLPDVRKDDMLARRTSVSEPRAAMPFNQYLPNKSNQSGYMPTPLRKKRSDKDDAGRKSWSTATSPVGGDRPFSPVEVPNLELPSSKSPCPSPTSTTHNVPETPTAPPALVPGPQFLAPQPLGRLYGPEAGQTPGPRIEVPNWRRSSKPQPYGLPRPHADPPTETTHHLTVSSEQRYRRTASASDDPQSVSMIDMRAEDEPHSQVRHDLMHNQYNRMKEDEDHWQDDLARWKNRRRSVSQDLIKKEEERKMMERLMSGEGSKTQRRKSIKTYREIVEEKERREEELRVAYRAARSSDEASAVLQRYAQRFSISEAVMELLQLPKLLDRSLSSDSCFPTSPLSLSASPTSPDHSPLDPDGPMRFLRQQSAPPPRFTATVEARVEEFAPTPQIRSRSTEPPSGRALAPKALPLLTPKPYVQTRPPAAGGPGPRTAKTDILLRVNGEAAGGAPPESPGRCSPPSFQPCYSPSGSSEGGGSPAPSGSPGGQGPVAPGRGPASDIPAPPSPATSLTTEVRQQQGSVSAGIQSAAPPEGKEGTAAEQALHPDAPQQQTELPKLNPSDPSVVQSEVTMRRSQPMSSQDRTQRTDAPQDLHVPKALGYNPPSEAELANSVRSPLATSNPQLRWEFFAAAEDTEKDRRGNCVQARQGDRWSWDPDEERKRQKRWQQEQERLLQEKYLQEQTKLKEEWERAQREVEEEERKYHEQERLILEETVTALTPHSSVQSSHSQGAPSPPTDPLPRGSAENEWKQRENDRTSDISTADDSMKTAKSLLSQNGRQPEHVLPPLQNGQNAALLKPQVQPSAKSQSLSSKQFETSPGGSRTPAATGDRRCSPIYHSTTPPPPDAPPPSTPNRSVSGKKLCSSCSLPLGKGAAMIIETLSLYFHIQCFKCGVCQGQLGDTTTGTDVRIRNGLLNCHQCYIRSRSAGQPTTL